jgi:hypothetical protein
MTVAPLDGEHGVVGGRIDGGDVVGYRRGDESTLPGLCDSTLIAPAVVTQPDVVEPGAAIGQDEVVVLQ